MKDQYQDVDEFIADWERERSKSVMNDIHERLANDDTANEIMSESADMRAAFVASVARQVASAMLRDYHCYVIKA